MVYSYHSSSYSDFILIRVLRRRKKAMFAVGKRREIEKYSSDINCCEAKDLEIRMFLAVSLNYETRNSVYSSFAKNVLQRRLIKLVRIIFS